METVFEIIAAGCFPACRAIVNQQCCKSGIVFLKLSSRLLSSCQVEQALPHNEPMYSAAYIQCIILVVERGTYAIAYLTTQSNAHATSVCEMSSTPACLATLLCRILWRNFSKHLPAHLYRQAGDTPYSALSLNDMTSTHIKSQFQPTIQPLNEWYDHPTNATNPFL